MSHPINFSKLYKIKWIIGGSAVMFIFFLGLSLVQNSPNQDFVGQDVQDFRFSFFNGYGWRSNPSATLSDFQGKVIVLNFWASWCPGCHHEAEILEKAYQKYASQEVVFIGVAWADTEHKSLEFLDRYSITYPNGPDLGLEMGERLHVSQLPETFVIDQNGEIAYSFRGIVTEQMLDESVLGLLE
ncbi:MAG: TlpA disulfide reductase family protein [Chloroflexota bacterium]